MARNSIDLWRVSKVASKVKRGTLSFGAAEIITYLLYPTIHASFPSLPQWLLVHVVSFIIGAVASINFTAFRTNSIGQLNNCLEDANLLFMKGLLTDVEHIAIRRNCIEKHLKE